MATVSSTAIATRGIAGPRYEMAEATGSETSHGRGRAVTLLREATAETAVLRGRLLASTAVDYAPSGGVFDAEGRAVVMACRAVEATDRMSTLNSGVAAAGLIVYAHAAQRRKVAIAVAPHQIGLSNGSQASCQTARGGDVTRPIGGRRPSLVTTETEGRAVSRRGICIGRVTPSSEIADDGRGGRAIGPGSGSTRTEVSLVVVIDGAAALVMAEKVVTSRSHEAAKVEVVTATTAVTTGPTRIMRTANGGAAGATKIAAQDW